MKLQEMITPEYVESLRKDILVFLKNIKRIKNTEQFKQLNIEWIKYLKGYFNDKMGKNVFSQGTVFASDESLFQKSYIEFYDYLKYALVPSKLEAKRMGAGYRGLSSDFGEDLIMSLTEKLPRNHYFFEKLIYGIDDAWDEAFIMFEKNSDSKYGSVKKKIDDFFNRLQYMVSNVVLKQFLITDQITIEGIQVDIEYSETETSKGTEFELIKNTVSDIGKAVKYIRDASLGKALNRANIKLSTVDISANRSNIKNGTDYGTGGFYKIANGNIEIFRGRINDVSEFGVIESIIHELGHKYYYEVLNSDQRFDWIKLYGELKEPSPLMMIKYYVSSLKFYLDKELEELEDFQQNYSLNTDEDLQKYARFLSVEVYLAHLKEYYNKHLREAFGFSFDILSDSASTEEDKLKILPKFKSLSQNQFALFSARLLKLLNFETERMGNEQVKFFPTKYGSENESEFWAETFTGYCLYNTSYGRNTYKLIDSVLEKFIEITGVKSAVQERKVMLFHMKRFREELRNERLIKKEGK